MIRIETKFWGQIGGGDAIGKWAKNLGGSVSISLSISIKDASENRRFRKRNSFKNHQLWHAVAIRPNGGKVHGCENKVN